jgi:predicted acyl esterase
MPDGARLAARIWLPEDAADDPVPAILEYIPYRKGDATAARDATRHPWFAGHGYAAVRVDMRGSGDSDGVLRDEYLPQEQVDGVEVLRWLAAQPWCTGACGIIGKSWGGFNGLQIAGRAPEELRAVISVCSTDDRYADDVHYLGGCVLGTDMLSWASTMLAFNARPPDPEVVGERWRELWLERLDGSPPFAEEWLRHQTRGSYWKQGSVCEDFAAIRCPVYMVGGWADPYRNAILRFLAGYAGPRKGLIGPWSHNYPDEGVPGPAIGFLQECLRWWDQHLKGRDTGIMDEPMLRVWMQEAVAPAAFHAERPGRWAAEEAWPSARIESRRLALAGPAPREIRGLQVCGLDAAAWIPWGNAGDYPPDQRPEDGRSLAFDLDPLAEAVEILGFPEVELELEADRPRALVAVRLCDVAPGGGSLLVTRGMLNLAHRAGHEHPEPLVPGERFRATVRLAAIAHAFPAGHRIRVALSPTYWPWAWPSPEPVTLTVHDAELLLPVRPARAEDCALATFDEPEQSPPLELEGRWGSRRPGRRSTVDLGTGAAETTVALDLSGSRRIVASGLEYAESGGDAFTILEGDPLSARARSEWTIAIGRGPWQTRVETASELTAGPDTFTLVNELRAFEGDGEVFHRAWHAEIPRGLV